MTEPVTGRWEVPGTDLEVTTTLEHGDLTIVLGKAGARVCRLIVEQAAIPIEHAWLSDMFMHDYRIRLSDLTSDLEDYVASLDLSQG
jgi:hypothetical protein